MKSDGVRRFASRADTYSKYRFPYPPKILDVLRREIGFDKEDIVADIGSGTGLLSKLFLSNGNMVFAVEPNAEMRSCAERDMAGFENFVSVNGKAERTTLRRNSIDLITAGEALHWFDPSKTIKEFSRVAKPGGILCVAYTRLRNDLELTGAVRKLIRKYERDLAKVPEMSPALASPYFKEGRYSEFKLRNKQMRDLESFKGFLLSMSFMPSPEEAGPSTKLGRAVHRLFDSYESGGQIGLTYETTVLLGGLET